MCSFWTVDWRFPVRAMGGHWESNGRVVVGHWEGTGNILEGHCEMKTPLREAALSIKVIALALLFLCSQRIMFASINPLSAFIGSKLRARLHVQLVMLISLACSVPDRSETSLKNC